MNRLIMAVLSVTILMTAKSGYAELLWPVGDSGNGHYYELVEEQDITWEQAKIAAENSYNSLGWQGHLATITTQAEQDFLGSTTFLGSSINIYGDIIWIGAYQTPPSPEIDGSLDWHWVTGEAWDFTYWDTGEPGNSSLENYAVMKADTWNYGKWNDCVNNQQAIGSNTEAYIIEYEPAASVPEPSAMALFLFGTVWIAKNIKRRMK